MEEKAEQVKQENNVDLAIEQVRKLQRAIYDYSKSPNDLFAMTNDIINQMQKASRDINVNFEEVSKQLTEKLNGKR